jgi:hypothetical protein
MPAFTGDVTLCWSDREHARQHSTSHDKWCCRNARRRPFITRKRLAEWREPAETNLLPMARVLILPGLRQVVVARGAAMVGPSS